MHLLVRPAGRSGGRVALGDQIISAEVLQRVPRRFITAVELQRQDIF